MRIMHLLYLSLLMMSRHLVTPRALLLFPDGPLSYIQRITPNYREGNVPL